MKTCPACGAQNPDTSIFCNACGARLDAAGPAPNPGPRYQNPDDGYPYGQGPAYGGQQGYGGMVVPRSIVLAIILTLITCGIYGIYWMCKVNDELNLLAGNDRGTSGGMVVVFNIITCGIYGIYWAYKMGQNCACLNGDSSGSILYLLLALFGFQIINLALFQDMINKCA